MCLSVYQNPFHLLSSLQTIVNKCNGDSIYNTVIQSHRFNFLLCALLLKYGLQKEIRIDFFKCLCQERYGSCIQRFWVFFFCSSLCNHKLALKFLLKNLDNNVKGTSAGPILRRYNFSQCCHSNFTLGLPLGLLKASIAIALMVMEERI